MPPGPQARTRAGTPLPAQADAAGFRRATAHCGFCGQAWFGEVAYCPYCGHPSATAPVATVPYARPEADSESFHAPSRGLAGDAGSSAAQTPSYAGRERSLAGSLREATTRLFGAPAGADAERPGTGRKTWAKPLALAAVLATFVLAVARLAGPDSDRPPPPAAMGAPGGDAVRGGTSEAGAGGAASTPAVPRAAIEPPVQPVQPVRPATPMQQAGPTQQAAPTQQAGPTQQAAPMQQAAPAPPARNRSLCSTANEAAGLCNAQ